VCRVNGQAQSSEHSLASLPPRQLSTELGTATQKAWLPRRQLSTESGYSHPLTNQPIKLPPRRRSSFCQSTSQETLLDKALGAIAEAKAAVPFDSINQTFSCTFLEEHINSYLLARFPEET